MLRIVMFLNILLGISISFAMSYLWGLINCLQMIIYVPLFNIVMPANITFVLSLLIRAATFDLPYIDDLIDYMFTPIYSVDEIEKVGFQQLGFETKNFIMNSGSLFIYTSIFFVIRVILAIIKRMAVINPKYVDLYFKTKPS
jgi:hypothetical protein